uniref:Putative secreted protein n=1 Tax=Ixodes scapularis TaxID=6945 RepID=A0A4D5REV8_IXOSC
MCLYFTKYLFFFFFMVLSEGSTTLDFKVHSPNSVLLNLYHEMMLCRLRGNTGRDILLSPENVADDASLRLFWGRFSRSFFNSRYFSVGQREG